MSIVFKYLYKQKKKLIYLLMSIFFLMELSRVIILDKLSIPHLNFTMNIIQGTLLVFMVILLIYKIIKEIKRINRLSKDIDKF